MFEMAQEQKETPARRRRRFQSMFGACCSLSAVVMAAPGILFPHISRVGAYPYIYAVLVTLPIIGIFIVGGIYLAGEKDDFIRMLAAQALLWGMGITLSVDTSWGFLGQLAGVYVPPLFANYALFMVASAIALVVLRWKHR